MKPFLVLILFLLAACSASLAPPAPTPADSTPWYHQAAANGTPVYAVDPGASLVTIVVRRAGVLSRLGHDHVVASHNAAGFAAPGANRADLAFRLDQLTVDEASLRHEAGLTTEPTQEAIDGTRTNMLTKVLDAERFPVVRVHVDRAGGGKLNAAITLHGVTRTVGIPATVGVDAGTITASGALSLRQTDFGITPLSVGGGLLSVDDTMELRFRIVARRWTGAGGS
jgi:polyisoprenoid-binding protein YceI